MEEQTPASGPVAAGGKKIAASRSRSTVAPTQEPERGAGRLHILSKRRRASTMTFCPRTSLMTFPTARLIGQGMHGIRALIRRHRSAAVWLAALALLVKALVPAGYMVGQSGTRTFDIIVCSDPTGGPVVEKLVIPFEKQSDHDGGRAAKGDCAFGALAYGGAPATDPALLIAAMAFILAFGFARVPAPSLRGFPRIRPPLRGPPASA